MKQRRALPAIDTAVAGSHGVSRDGQAISYNRAPAADIAPWIGRLYATKIDLLPGGRLDCGLLNDTACVRIQLRGDWRAETATGAMHLGPAALLFGPQTRRMPISVAGNFISIGLALRPGAGAVMNAPRVVDYVDQIVDLAALRTQAPNWLEQFALDAEPETWVLQLEAGVRRRLDETGWVQPDPVVAAFEALSFTDPNASVSNFARQHGVERRTLERVIRRAFGMSPKQVLRRARALDMASHLRGVADQAEADDLALRYYDQSHLIREFSELFGMSPRQFVSTPQPILTLALESRQARRLEALERLTPGALRPWQ